MNVDKEGNINTTYFLQNKLFGTGQNCCIFDHVYFYRKNMKC